MVNPRHMNMIWQGTWLTLELLAASAVLALLLAMVLTFLKQCRIFWLDKLIDGFIFFIRGTPLLVQFFLIYYGSGQLAWLRHSLLWPFFREAYFCAVLTMVLNSAAYTTVLLLGAIKSVPKGEREAGLALGLPTFWVFTRLTLPRGLRLALPAYSNEVVMILKGTSLASTITLLELTGVTRRIIAQTYQSMTFLLIAGLIYLGLNGVIVAAFRYAERRWPLPQTA